MRVDRPEARVGGVLADMVGWCCLWDETAAASGVYREGVGTRRRREWSGMRFSGSTFAAAVVTGSEGCIDLLDEDGMRGEAVRCGCGEGMKVEGGTVSYREGEGMGRRSVLLYLWCNFPL